jgi:hypothetical protein
MVTAMGRPHSLRDTGGDVDTTVDAARLEARATKRSEDALDAESYDGRFLVLGTAELVAYAADGFDQGLAGF